MHMAYFLEEKKTPLQLQRHLSFISKFSNHPNPTAHQPTWKRKNEPNKHPIVFKVHLIAFWLDINSI